MRRRSILLGIATLFLPILASARADLYIAPLAQASSEGNANNGFPLLLNGGIHYQQVFGASEFSSAGSPLLITALSFRQDGALNLPFNTTLSSVMIQLTTTSKAVDGLDTTFANNLGADVTTVFNGSLSLSSSNGVGPGGTRAFDLVITFQNSFLYDPSKGNLLLDIANANTGDSRTGASLDAQNTTGDSISRIFALGAGSTVATTSDSIGLVTRFTAQSVPEPSSVVMLGLGLASMATIALGRRLRRS